MTEKPYPVMVAVKGGKEAIALALSIEIPFMVVVLKDATEIYNALVEYLETMNEKMTIHEHGKKLG